MDPRALLGSVDIRESDKDYQFIVDVPGATKDDVKVRVSGDNVLTIEGERKVSAASYQSFKNGMCSFDLTRKYCVMTSGLL